MDRKIFAELRIDLRGHTGGQLKTICPQCSSQRTNKKDKSLSVNLYTNQYYCHYCGWKGVATNREHRQVGDPLVANSQPEANTNTLHQPLTDKQLEWFANERHIPQEVLVLAGVTSATEYMAQAKAKVNCICFNFFEDGELVNTKFRDGHKNFKLLQGARLLPYNIDSIRHTTECIITEGEIDALSFMAAGRTDVISVPNGAGSHLDWLDEYSQTHFEDKRVIYIAVDSDRKGRELRRELLRRLGKERCRVVDFGDHYKDANELLVAQNPEALLRALADAPELPVEGIFTATDLHNEFWQLLESDYVPTTSTGMTYFDNICTLETKRSMIVTGIPGSGKSEFVDELAIRLCMHNGWRIGYFSPENTPITYHLRKLAERVIGRRFQKDNLSNKEFEQVVAFLTENVSHILPHENFNIDTILQKARELVHRRGIRTLVIDPYNSLDHQIPKNLTETTYISIFLDKLKTFAVRYDCLVILVAHPHKMPTNPLTGQPFPPSMYDVNGSAGFFNKADYGISIDRDKTSSLVTVRVLKVKFRHLGMGGEAHYCFNIINGRYKPCIKPADPDGKVLPMDGSGHLFDSESWLPAAE